MSLTNVKKGDDISIRQSGVLTRIVKVEKASSDFIEAGDIQFNRDGSVNTTNIWGVIFARSTTDADHDEMKRKVLLARIKSLLNDYTWRDVSLKELKKITKLLDL